MESFARRLLPIALTLSLPIGLAACRSSQPEEIPNSNKVPATSAETRTAIDGLQVPALKRRVDRAEIAAELIKEPRLQEFLALFSN